jgi:hypothetical protein
MEDVLVRTARVTLIGLSMALLVSACSGGSSSQSSTSPQPKPSAAAATASPDSTASTVSSGSVAITDIKLAKDFTYGDVVNQTTSFYPTDKEFHLVVDLAQPSEGTRVGATWYAVDAGSYKNERLDSQTYTLKSGEDRVHVTLTNKGTWPRGKYKVDVMVDDKLARSMNFQVQ